MQPYDRIEKLLSYLKLSANKFAKEIGLPNGRPQRLYDIKSKGHGISSDLARLITETYPQINYEWLLSGEGEMVKTYPETEEYDRPEGDISDQSKRIAELEETIKDLRLDKEDLRSQRDIWQKAYHELKEEQFKKRDSVNEGDGHTLPAGRQKR